MCSTEYRIFTEQPDRVPCAGASVFYIIYRTIMGFNSELIALGLIGVLQPTTTALLHNASTIAIGMKSMTKLI